MTELALKNPIAIAMACIAVIVFAAVVTPRMTVDTFPELTPPVLVIGTLAPGLGPKDVEKTLTWRIEKYVSATPGVDHVESTSRNNLSVVFVWLKWGTNLDAAQSLVQQQVAFAMAAVPKSLGVLPPFVLAVRPVERAGRAGRGLRRRDVGPQLYDYALNNIEPKLEGISGVASASVNGGRQRQINVVVDPAKAQARGVTSDGDRADRRERESAAAVGRADHEAVRRERLHERDRRADRRHRRRDRQAPERQAGARSGRRARRGRRVAADAGGVDQRQDGVYLNVLRIPGGNTIEIVDAVKATIAELAQPAAGHGREADLRSVDVRAQLVRGAQEGDRPGARPRRDRDPRVPAVDPRHARRVVRDPAVVRDHADRAVRDRPDAQRVHARRAHARDGPARRRRGRRARVDPPPSQARAVGRRAPRSRAPTRSCCRCSRRR